MLSSNYGQEVESEQQEVHKGVAAAMYVGVYEVLRHSKEGADNHSFLQPVQIRSAILV